MQNGTPPRRYNTNRQQQGNGQLHRPNEVQEGPNVATPRNTSNFPGQGQNEPTRSWPQGNRFTNGQQRYSYTNQREAPPDSQQYVNRNVDPNDMDKIRRDAEACAREREIKRTSKNTKTTAKSRGGHNANRKRGRGATDAAENPESQRKRQRMDNRENSPTEYTYNVDDEFVDNEFVDDELVDESEARNPVQDLRKHPSHSSGPPQAPVNANKAHASGVQDPRMSYTRTHRGCGEDSRRTDDSRFRHGNEPSSMRSNDVRPSSKPRPSEQHRLEQHRPKQHGQEQHHPRSEQRRPEKRRPEQHRPEQHRPPQDSTRLDYPAHPDLPGPTDDVDSQNQPANHEFLSAFNEDGRHWIEIPRGYASVMVPTGSRAAIELPRPGACRIAIQEYGQTYPTINMYSQLAPGEPACLQTPAVENQRIQTNSPTLPCPDNTLTKDLIPQEDGHGNQHDARGNDPLASFHGDSGYHEGSSPALPSDEGYKDNGNQSVFPPQNIRPDSAPRPEYDFSKYSADVQGSGAPATGREAVDTAPRAPQSGNHQVASESEDDFDDDGIPPPWDYLGRDADAQMSQHTGVAPNSGSSSSYANASQQDNHGSESAYYDDTNSVLPQAPPQAQPAYFEDGSRIDMEYASTVFERPISSTGGTHIPPMVPNTHASQYPSPYATGAATTMVADADVTPSNAPQGSISPGDETGGRFHLEGRVGGSRVSEVHDPQEQENPGNGDDDLPGRGRPYGFSTSANHSRPSSPQQASEDLAHGNEVTQGSDAVTNTIRDSSDGSSSNNSVPNVNFNGLMTTINWDF